MRTYLALLRLPGTARFSAAGFIGRLPIAMLSLGIVLLVTSVGGSYALAGALSATFALAAAFVSPLGLRWADRVGQHRSIPYLAAVEVLGLIGFTMSVQGGSPGVWSFLFAFVSGATSPHVGSLVRARWADRLSGTPRLQSAFAWEAVVDEMVFIIGPPVMTLMALRLGEAAAMYAVVALILCGVGWLASQRSTEPAVHARRADRAPVRLWSAQLVVVVLVLVLLGGVFGSFEVATIAFTRAAGAAGLTGVVLALYAAGSLTSGLVIGARPPARNPARTLLADAAVLAVVGAPLPWAGSVSALMPLAFLAGLSVSPLLIITTTIIESRVPAARLTEALGISISGLAVGVAIGSTSAGALIDAGSPAAGFGLMAVCGVGALLVAATTGRVLR